ncbi:zinc finger protein 808-like [Haliotis rufescens]|uniref:zinc finger protein 808-like n=1 Tax=Haliotis rufescens TaxID=6454 RepID=UPI00201F62A7|nr:zinc finger protein 808-like [Haliotis rufescens]
MACNMELSSAAGNGRSREDRNCLPSPKGPLYVEDLFLQSDTEVTPMTDIEDSSDDEVHNEEYLGIRRQSVHDEAKNSPDFIHFSNLGTTNRMHATQDGNRTRCPVVDTAGRDRNSGNDEEELDELKRVHVHTRSSSLHDDPVSRLWPRVDYDVKVKTEAVLSDLEVSSMDLQTNNSGRGVMPGICGADMQATRHGTVYKHGDEVRSYSVCQDRIKKEIETPATGQTASSAHEHTSTELQSEEICPKGTGIRSMTLPFGDDVLAAACRADAFDYNIYLKKEHVSGMVYDHQTDTAMDRGETKCSETIDTQIAPVHITKNIHTHDGGVGSKGGGDDDGVDGDDEFDDGGGNDGNGDAHDLANSGILIKEEVCDSDEEFGSVMSHHGSDVAKVVSAMDGGNSHQTESRVDMVESLAFATRLDNPREHTALDNVHVNMTLATTRQSVTPNVKPLVPDASGKDPLSTDPSEISPRVPLEREAPGKSVSQQQSSPRHTKQQKKKRGRKPKALEKCPVCKKRFPSSDLKQHITKSHRHKCKICGKTIKDFVLFQGHMREHADEPTPYWCDLCDKRFDRFVTLEKHRRMHTLKGRWECSKCGKVFTRKDNYFTHLKVHEDSNLNKCEVCGRQYASPANLRKHMVVHLEEKPIECPVCEERFNFKSTLDYHMHKHTAASLKSATCEICGMECIHKNALAIHMNIHTGRKPHVCIYCGKRFAQLSTKIGHEMTHENPNKKSLDSESEEQRTKNMLQSFDCDLCLMSFTSLELLNGHTQKTHANVPKETPSSQIISECIKPYSCGICGIPFLSVSGLRKHRSKKHPDNVAVGKGRYSSLGKNLNSSEKTRTDKTVDKGVTSTSARNSKKPTLASEPEPESESESESESEPEPDPDPDPEPDPSPAKDLPTPKRKSDSTKDLPKSKKRSTDGESESNFDKNKCNICGKLVLELRNHMKYHSEKAYVCRVCGMRFTISANLKRHLRLHTGETPYQCKICGERFMKAEALKKHTARHEGRELEKKYECPTCGKKFLDSYHMKRHTVVHKRWPKIRDTEPVTENK